MHTDKWYGVRFLIPYLKKYNKTVFFTVLSMIGVAITSALGAYMMKPILNNIFVEKDEVMLYFIPLIIILVFVSRGLFRFFATYLADSVGIAITSEIRNQMFDKAINAQYAKIESKTIGDINAHIIQTVLNLKNIIVKTIPKYIISAMTIIALIVMIVYLNWKLSLLSILFASVVIYPVKILGKKVKGHVSNSEKMISGLSNKINETFNHLDLVKIYNNTDLEQREFNKTLEDYQKFQLKLAKYQEITSPIMELFVSLAVAAVVFFGGLSVIKGEMTVGDFFAFLTALLMLYAPIKVVTKNSIVLNMLDTYIKRIEDILSLPQEQEGAEKLNQQINSIKFDNATLKIGEKHILKNINFTINQGETIALVGKTGAGKSSILTLLFGFRSCSSGKVLINDKDIAALDNSSIRDEISYVNQSAGIFNTTIKENIIYGLEFDQDRYDESIRLAHCEFIKDLIGQDDYIVGENGKKLSGGQRQRLALARAIYKDGSLFVLDEATSALDANTENMIQSSLEEIMKQKTTIVIAHRLSTIRNADKVVVLSEGTIVEIGGYEEVSNTVAFKNNFALNRGANE
jgi:subfamily B ATP-binding cassette protein MsbA